MTSGDDLQQLWQAQGSGKEPVMELIHEKRTSFDELVRAENMAEYVVALILVPLMGVMAFKSRVPVAGAGFALLAITIGALAVVTWLVYRRSHEPHDLSLREHLDFLVARYEQRVRFLRTGTIAVGVLLSIGIVLIFFGSWLSSLMLILPFWVAQWWLFQKRKGVLLKKRAVIEGMLRELGQ
jgi:hypothetical protein